MGSLAMKQFLIKTLLLALFSVATLSFGQTIPQQIDTILARSAVAGNTWTILVQNETGTVTYYQKNPTTGKAPASNTKIFTTAAAFGLLGTNHSFESRIYYTGTFSGGVVSGNLNLVCEHDMTWNEDTLGTGNSRKGLDFITTKLKALGLAAVSGNVQVYGVCMYDRDSTDDTRTLSNQASYNTNAAIAFQAALFAQGITTGGSASGQTGFTPPGTLLYTYQSTNLTYNGKPLQLDVACIPLMKVSHNVMADELLRHIGYKISGTDSFTAGKNQVFAWLQNTVGISTAGTTMLDGSGLSHSDSFSAQQVVSVVRYMLGPTYPTWKTTLPIGCYDGTIGGRFCGTDGANQVHAKTGSLSISIALSGYIDNKNDNRRYLFSFLSNVVDPNDIDQPNTRDAIDDCVVLLGARGVPTSPQITSVTNRANGSLRVSWSDEGFVRTNYLLYGSADGITFDPAISLGSNVQNYTETLPLGTKRYYRVSVGGTGGEGPPSRVYGAKSSNSKSPVLIVDGEDRWQSITNDNPNANNHPFAAIAGQSINGPAFDTVNHDAVINGTVPLTNYPEVVWLLGEDSTVDESFSTAEQALVTSYLTTNGNLFLSGSEIGWDLDRPNGTTSPTTADRNFYHNQLRATYANDDAATYSFASTTNSIFSGNASGTFDNGTHGTYNVDFPDVLTPTGGSVSAMTYVGGTGGTAAVVYDGSPTTGKVVNFGIPFETIAPASARDAYMFDILRFFGVIAEPKFSAPQLAPPQIVLSWNASAGLKYRLQYKTDLSLPTWTDVAPDITATNTIVTATNSIGSTAKFFRVLLVN
ncbi:MAG: D-alanyl-D-alanine carboxypeptidase/D-alanyl-D-alanine-endopeptidase [Verrucomicrobiales bacterium]|nr:D-alanyl-D-alanine carboxypeptidase/D-alanyl-D-alanine-endopeptidase [Verrucomicrobiales bacterium]